MMLQVKNVIRAVDQFGSVYTPRVYHRDKEYKTLIGGIFSIVIYGLSSGFFLYSMIMWGTDQNLPQVTVSNKVLDAYEFDVNSIIGSIYIKPSVLYTKIDPFSANNLIFMPLFVVQVNGEPVNSQSRVLLTQSVSPYNLSQVDLKNLRFGINTQDQNTSGIKSLNYMLALQSCDQGTLKYFNMTNYTCANSSYVQQYFDQWLNIVTVTYQVQQYNIQSRKMSSISKEYNIAIDQNSTFYLQSFLRSSVSSVDTGILIQDESSQEVIADVTGTLQQLNSGYFQKVFQNMVYGVIEYELDYIQIQQNVAYQKISDVLANIGSIVSLLLMLSYIFFKLSEYLQDEEIQRKVIEMYYPHFKSVKINRDYLGRIKSITNKEQAYNVEEFKLYYDKLRTVAQQKLTVLNQIYEISRIQLILNIRQQQIEEVKQKQSVQLLIANELSNEYVMRNQVVIYIFYQTPLNEADTTQQMNKSIFDSHQLVHQLTDFQLLVYEPNSQFEYENKSEPLREIT